MSFEVSVRCIHPEKTYMPPNLLVSIAGKKELIQPIDFWVLQTACRQLKKWQQRKVVSKDITISFNLSAKQFSHSNLIEYIDKILENTELAPQCLKLEITGSAIIGNFVSVKKILQQLRERKIQLILGDFNIGSYSLRYLHQLPLNTVKIDRSLMSVRMDNLKNVAAMITLAHKLNMNIIAEGVIVIEQMNYLKQLNCEMGQGYLFADPLDQAAAKSLLKQSPKW